MQTEKSTAEDSAAPRCYAELVNRLRGIYTIPVNDGIGPLNGSNTFTRKFDGLPPIHGEAADAIEDLLTRLRRCGEIEA